jgi:hypothetical protein
MDIHKFLAVNYVPKCAKNLKNWWKWPRDGAKVHWKDPKLISKTAFFLNNFQI